MSEHHLPIHLAREVEQIQTLLQNLVGRTRQLQNMTTPESDVWKALAQLRGDFCVVLSAAHSAVSILGALKLTDQMEQAVHVDALQLELHPGYRPKPDHQMMAANDHSFEE